MYTFLGKIENLNVSKYIMQLRCVITWAWKGGKGTIEAATGLGKSIIACIAIKKIRMKRSCTVLVIVPTIQLKSQWEGVLSFFNLEATVLVVNTIALKKKTYSFDLLVVDEIHMMAADKFSRIFDLVKYRWILGLTATINRQDGRETLLKKYAPVVKTITQREAIEKGWINDFIEINVPIYLTREEKAGLHNVSKQIAHYTGKFGDFDVMRSCMNSENAKAYAMLYFPEDDLKQRTAAIVRDAVQGQRYIRLRQEFLYKTQHKVDATVDLINEFGLKTITFSQSTDFADEVKAQVSGAVAYHSNLEKETREVRKTKRYKTEKSARRFAEMKGVKPSYKDGEYVVTWYEPKVFGATTLKKEALDSFLKSESGVICTAKALDQGFDAPDIVIGIDASRTGNPTQHVQRTGRVARDYTYPDGTEKQAVYINLYVPDSRDEQWLRKCQNPERVIWASDLEDCKQLVKTVLYGNLGRV